MVLQCSVEGEITSYLNLSPGLLVEMLPFFFGSSQTLSSTILHLNFQTGTWVITYSSFCAGPHEIFFDLLFLSPKRWNADELAEGEHYEEKRIWIKLGLGLTHLGFATL